MIERAYLDGKRKEYYEAYQQALSSANANHGAMLAIDDLLAKLDADEAAAQPEPDGENDD